MQEANIKKVLDELEETFNELLDESDFKNELQKRANKSAAFRSTSAQLFRQAKVRVMKALWNGEIV